MLPLSTALGSSLGLHGGKSGFEDETTEVQYPRASVDYGLHVAARGFSLKDYSYEELWLTVAQVGNGPHPLLYVMYVPHKARHSCSLLAFISSTTLWHDDSNVQLRREP